MEWIQSQSLGATVIALVAIIAWIIVFGIALLLVGFSLPSLATFALISLCGWGVGSYILR